MTYGLSIEFKKDIIERMYSGKTLPTDVYLLLAEIDRLTRILGYKEKIVSTQDNHTD